MQLPFRLKYKIFPTSLKAPKYPLPINNQPC